MAQPKIVGWIARGLGVDRNRSLVNANPDPVRRARERREQYLAIRQKTDAVSARADARTFDPPVGRADTADV